jgi:hypothetical protein
MKITLEALTNGHIGLNSALHAPSFRKRYLKRQLDGKIISNYCRKGIVNLLYDLSTMWFV